MPGVCCPHKPYTPCPSDTGTHTVRGTRNLGVYFSRVFPHGRAWGSFSLQPAPEVPDNLGSSGTRSRKPGGSVVSHPGGDSGTPRCCCAQTPLGAELGPRRPRCRCRCRSPAAPAGAAPRHGPAPAAPPPMELRGGAGALPVPGTGRARTRFAPRGAGESLPLRCRSGPGPAPVPSLLVPPPRRSRSGPCRAASTETGNPGGRAPARPLSAVPTLPGAGVTAGRRRLRGRGDRRDLRRVPLPAARRQRYTWAVAGSVLTAERRRYRAGRHRPEGCGQREMRSPAPRSRGMRGGRCGAGDAGRPCRGGAPGRDVPGQIPARCRLPERAAGGAGGVWLGCGGGGRAEPD